MKKIKIGQIQRLEKKIKKLIKQQTTLGSFVDWDDWLKDDFYPLYQQYKNAHTSMVSETTQITFIDFETKVKNIMCHDCDMKLYD